MNTHKNETIDQMVICLAGDSGDGIQLIGKQLSNFSSKQGLYTRTFSEYPAEIRAPIGSLYGISAFKIHLSTTVSTTFLDQADILVALNPAALKKYQALLKKNGVLIVNQNNFEESFLKKAGYSINPLETNELNDYQVIQIPINKQINDILSMFSFENRQGRRSQNMFVLGVLHGLLCQEIQASLQWVQTKFAHRPESVQINQKLLEAGYQFAERELNDFGRFLFPKTFFSNEPYRQVTGNEAFALAGVSLAKAAQTSLVVSGYPITPASEILQTLTHYADMNVRVFQSEDEIAAMCSTIGASYAGALALTCTSGPGFDLKTEALGLAVMAELPLVVINVQRAGPSTGIPTRSEQTDLWMAIFGRHGECPLPVMAASSPSDCFDVLFEAFQIAHVFMTPVVVLSDAFIAGSSEPWILPKIDELPNVMETHKTMAMYGAYDRHLETLARTHVIPGTPDKTYVIGGLERDKETGLLSNDPDNHEAAIHLRAHKIKGVAKQYSPTVIQGEKQGKLLVVGWGSTYGAITTSVSNLQKKGHSVSQIHLRHVFPLPNDLELLFENFETILVPENNSGQLGMLLRSFYQKEIKTYSRVTGHPFLITELENEFLRWLN